MPQQSVPIRLTVRCPLTPVFTESNAREQQLSLEETMESIHCGLLSAANQSPKEELRGSAPALYRWNMLPWTAVALTALPGKGSRHSAGSIWEQLLQSNGSLQVSRWDSLDWSPTVRGHQGCLPIPCLSYSKFPLPPVQSRRLLTNLFTKEMHIYILKFIHICKYMHLNTNTHTVYGHLYEVGKQVKNTLLLQIKRVVAFGKKKEVFITME